MNKVSALLRRTDTNAVLLYNTKLADCLFKSLEVACVYFQSGQQIYAELETWYKAHIQGFQKQLVTMSRPSLNERWRPTRPDIF